MYIFLGKEFIKGRVVFNSLFYHQSVKTASTNTTAGANKVQNDEMNNKDDWFNQVVEGDIDERVVPKPISIMPDHLPQVRRRIKQKPWWKFRYFVDINTPPLENEEYTKEPEYPPIYDPTGEGMKKQIRLEWYNAIRRLPSAEQKIYEIGKHYKHLSYILEPVTKQYNSLSIQQSITQTQLIHSLPDSYKVETVEMDQNLKQALLTMIGNRLFHTKSRKSTLDFKKSEISQFGFANKENFVQTSTEEDILIDAIQLIRNFESNQDSLSPVQIDYNPFVATSWWMNDYPIPFKKAKWFKNDHHDQCFVYKSTHAVHIRTQFPLKEVLPLNDPQCKNELVNKPKLNLLQLGFPLKRQNIVSMPGFWPSRSEGYDFPYLIGHSCENVRLRQEKSIHDFNDRQDVHDGMAIMSGFSWLTSVANNLGFSIYDHLTYPLVTHVVITDGQYWSFYVYQLNNHAFHSDIIDQKPMTNLCWSSGDLKLFDTFENGTFTGLNDDVLHILLKFANAPIQTETNIDLRPYLSDDHRDEIEKAELSYSLRRTFFNANDSFIAARKKTNLWETIYKNHKDAPMDLKRIRPKLDFKNPPFFK